VSTPPPEPESLTGAERTRLRGMAMGLKPALGVGRAGVSASVIAEASDALAREGLIKVRFQLDDRDAIDCACAELAAATGASLVGRVGKTAAFWKRKPPAA